MTADPPAVRVQDLRVTLDGSRIVDGIDLTVERGQWLIVIGPNGAGKSTLLRAVGGLLAYTGTVELFGAAGAGLRRRDRARIVAMVMQSPIVPVGMTVFDYVLLGRTPYIAPLGRESTADLDAAWAVLGRLGLTGFAGRELATLSGGERQRVYLARALAQGASLLLLDEPTSALDIGHQQEVLELVDRLRRDDGLTVVATTHDLSVAGEYADRLVLLTGGRVAAVGRPADVLTADVLSEHYGAQVRIIEGDHGPLVVPVRSKDHQTG